MNAPPGPARCARGLFALIAASAFVGLVGACAAGTGAATASLSEAEWRTLAAPRPSPLPGAVRLSVADVEVVGEAPWPAHDGVPGGLGLAELAAAGLLRRSDVRFVERRRFSAAVEAERTGTVRPPGAPPAGVSPGAEVSALLVWVALGGGRASLEVRLSQLETGSVAGSRRVLVPADADLVGLGRVAVSTILRVLSDGGRLPSWDDPLADAAPAEYLPSGVPPSAVGDFMIGLEAEDRWSWEDARRAYLSAARSAGFFEAETALARTARLRLGGTLGQS